MNHGRIRDVAVAPLTTEQRQRLECLTAARELYASGYGNNTSISIAETVAMADWLATGCRVRQDEV